LGMPTRRLRGDLCGGNTASSVGAAPAPMTAGLAVVPRGCSCAVGACGRSKAAIWWAPAQSGGSFFGNSVVISADGTTSSSVGLLTTFVDPATFAYAGAAWVFTRSGGVLGPSRAASWLARVLLVARSRAPSVRSRGMGTRPSSAGTTTTPRRAPRGCSRRSGDVSQREQAGAVGAVRGLLSRATRWRSRGTAQPPVVGGPSTDSGSAPRGVLGPRPSASGCRVGGSQPWPQTESVAQRPRPAQHRHDTANTQIKFFGTAGVASNTTYVPPGRSRSCTDVGSGQLGASGQGALEVLSDQPLRVTEPHYNQVSSTASCYPQRHTGPGLTRLLAAATGSARVRARTWRTYRERLVPGATSGW